MNIRWFIPIMLFGAFIFVLPGCKSPDADKEQYEIEYAQCHKVISPSEYSDYAEIVLAERMMGMDMRVSDLPRSSLPHGRGYERIDITPPELLMDGIHYVIYIDHSTCEYWIRAKGGVAGSDRIWGPGQINTNLIKYSSNALESAGASPAAGSPETHP